MGFKDDTMMQWPAYTPNLSPIENSWGTIIKRKVYAYIRQFFSKDDLWKAVQDAVSSVEQPIIKS